MVTLHPRHLAGCGCGEGAAQEGTGGLELLWLSG